MALFRHFASRRDGGEGRAQPQELYSRCLSKLFFGTWRLSWFARCPRLPLIAPGNRRRSRSNAARYWVSHEGRVKKALLLASARASRVPAFPLLPGVNSFVHGLTAEDSCGFVVVSLRLRVQLMMTIYWGDGGLVRRVAFVPRGAVYCLPHDARCALRSSMSAIVF